MLGRIFGTRRDEVRGGWRIFRIREFRYFVLLSVYYSKRMILAGLIARRGDKK
jgi:hypothetical protein